MHETSRYIQGVRLIHLNFCEVFFYCSLIIRIKINVDSYDSSVSVSLKTDNLLNAEKITVVNSITGGTKIIATLKCSSYLHTNKKLERKKYYCGYVNG